MWFNKKCFSGKEIKEKNVFLKGFKRIINLLIVNLEFIVISLIADSFFKGKIFEGGRKNDV